ncbi:MAG: hypothetical protein AB1730_21945 [Myxococcota bacterium]
MLSTCILLTFLAADGGRAATSTLTPMPAAGPDAAVPAAVGAGNLLRRATLTMKAGAPDAERMADGTAPSDGDLWKTQYTAVLAPAGSVVWDFGMVRPIGATRIQADNNDTYHLDVSMDGATWTRLWSAKPVDVPGVQTRTSEPLSAQGRYVRLTAEGGDSMYSVGELEVFETVQDLVGAQLQRIPLPPPPKPVPPPPFDSGLLVALAAAGYGAWLLQQARKRNLAARRPSEPAAEPKADGKNS